MEIPDVVSARRFKGLNSHQKQEVYETLLTIESAIDEIPQKSIRKILEVTFAVLRFKGAQVVELQEQLKSEGKSTASTAQSDGLTIKRLNKENEKLKRLLCKADDENKDLNERNKKLVEELMELKKRLQTVTNPSVASDKDSSDPLSELERHEELLSNINAKNKHIKRLLKEVETLQNQNVEQTSTIIATEKELKLAKAKLMQLSKDITEVDGERKALKQTVNELQVEIGRHKTEMSALKKEALKNQRELNDYIRKLEAKAKSLKDKLETRDREIGRLRDRLDREGCLTDDMDKSGNGDSVDEYQTVKEELKQLLEENKGLLHTIEARDHHIERLEEKVQRMAEEMAKSVGLLHIAIDDKVGRRDQRRPRACCKALEESLQAANERCRELSDMLATAEEENELKSKDIIQARITLEAYQSGDSGLARALKKCSSLERKVASRDKQIRLLTAELNTLQDVGQENIILRKRLDIPEDVVIVSKNWAAKERCKDKVIEKLKLRLRASEEKCLQLRLERSDLRKQLIRFQTALPSSSVAPDTEEASAKEVPPDEVSPDKLPSESTDIGATSRRSDSIESLPYIPSEAGEIPDSSAVQIAKRNRSGVCLNCHAMTQVYSSHNRLAGSGVDIEKIKRKCQSLKDENHVLRSGMQEILERLREYNATSEHIIIDGDLLHRLLNALNYSISARTLSNIHTTSRDPQKLPMGDQPLSDERQQQQLQQQQQQQEERPDSGDINNQTLDWIEDPEPTADITPPANASADEIVDRDTTATTTDDKANLSMLVSNLEIYRKLYEDLRDQMRSSETDIVRYCADLVDKIAELELQLSKKARSYDYMRADFDQTLTKLKQNEMGSIQVVSGLKKDLHKYRNFYSDLKEEYVRYRGQYNSWTEDEYVALKKSYVELQSKLAYMVDQVLTGQVAPELQPKDLCAEYGVIEDDQLLDIVTAQEFNRQRAALQTAADKEQELRQKSQQLESLLDVAQDQIKSQQRLLNEITDNHIGLRHLVADLQSETEDKFLLAKMQRDLESGKMESERLRSEREELKQKCDHLEASLSAEKALTDTMTKDFQLENKTKDTKIKYLLKSLHIIREKYGKFTPLVFLTNFVYAYTQFVRKSTNACDDDKHRLTTAELMAEVDRRLEVKLQTENFGQDESQNLIKAIKMETQCKLLERQVADLQGICDSLKQEINEERIRSANESEHWQTIGVLFKEPKSIRQPGAPDVERRDAATNTDGSSPDTSAAAPPVPAERRRPQGHTADKSLSPIPSPIKKTIGLSTVAAEVGVCSETATQTERAGPTDDDTRGEGNEKGSTNEVSIQAGPLGVSSQGVQTMVPMEPKESSPATNGDRDVTKLEGKLKEALQGSKERDQNLQKAKDQLAVAEKRVTELEQLLKEARETQTRGQRDQPEVREHAGIVEKTITSFHGLLFEKDKSITKYQDLLQSERDQNQATVFKLHSDMENLRRTIADMDFNVRTKDMEILELKTKLEALTVRRNSNEKLDLANGDGEGEDNSLHELTDEKIDEMFQQENEVAETPSADAGVKPNAEPTDDDAKPAKEIRISRAEGREMQMLLRQHKAMQDKIAYAEKTLQVKDEEIALLKEKVNMYREREKTLDNTITETEHLRLELEEKEKHIKQLMDTLNSFHDDQQQYLDDSTHYSTDQIAKLTADLTRIEATNKIYQTQVEAMRRQIATLAQREKQAREQAATLRSQLIKRPVVSIKTELNSRVKCEQLQKRVQQLELDLEDARVQIKRQQSVIDAKRARSAAEVSLWEKQKRWQQSAEKLKAKLDENEILLEKTRSLLQAAKTTIARLEKDKQILETKVDRALAGGGGGGGVGSTLQHVSNMKCCRAPSCPNLHHAKGGGVGGGCGGGGAGASASGKYTPSESPETYTGCSSDCSSTTSCTQRNGGRSSSAPKGHYSTTADQNSHAELIEALKARLELQQRRIIAMEMEGKGSNVLTTELERAQERCSAIEAANVRLESKNLELQLENDRLRQGDSTERMQKRVKHLEDYIIVLKEEMAQLEARSVLCKCSGMKLTSNSLQPAEQTILSLKRIVEKLRAENKYFKESRRSGDKEKSNGNNRGSSPGSVANADVAKLQQAHAEALEKISALQMELDMREKCPYCYADDRTGAVGGTGKMPDEAHILRDEIKLLREQLDRKGLLLQKVKVLLTRAAAKEKVLKEQLLLWKRKCSELQNVPVIDEISE